MVLICLKNHNRSICLQKRSHLNLAYIFFGKLAKNELWWQTIKDNLKQEPEHFYLLALPLRNVCEAHGLLNFRSPKTRFVLRTAQLAYKERASHSWNSSGSSVGSYGASGWTVVASSNSVNPSPKSSKRVGCTVVAPSNIVTSSSSGRTVGERAAKAPIGVWPALSILWLNKVAAAVVLAWPTAPSQEWNSLGIGDNWCLYDFPFIAMSVHQKESFCIT